MVGWIRGYKTQGSARAVIEVPLKDLYQKLIKRFLTPRGNKSRSRSPIQELNFSRSGVVYEVQDDDDPGADFQAPLSGEQAALLLGESDGTAFFLNQNHMC